MKSFPDRRLRDALAEKHYPHLMPLEHFPPKYLDRITKEITSDRPPPRWRDLGMAKIPSRGWLEWHLHRGVDPARRERIRPLIRAAVIKRDGYNCGICGGKVAPNDVHLDHITPYSRGGPTTIDNLRVTHAHCNLRRGARTDGP